MKKALVVALVGMSFAGSAFAASEHQNYVGSVAGLKDNLVIRDANQVADLVKYASTDVKLKLMKAYNEDGKLTAEEIKSSGISDHHFYTGYLASSTTQSQYDARLKEMNGGKNMDDHFVSNRDLKAHGSMVMNQVETQVQGVVVQQNKVDAAQDQRVDKIVAGLKELGDHLNNAPTAPVLPDNGGQVVDKPVTPPVETNKPYDDTQVKNDIATNAGNIANNTNSIQQMGAAFEQRVDKVDGWMNKTDSTLRNHTNAINDMGNALKAESNYRAREIARLDGRIDRLEEKTDKLKAGVAGAHAVASLTQYTGKGIHHVAIGIGGYEGESALAGGYTFAITDNTTIRGTVAYDSQGDFGYGVSVGHSW